MGLGHRKGSQNEKMALMCRKRKKIKRKSKTGNIKRINFEVETNKKMGKTKRGETKTYLGTEKNQLIKGAGRNKNNGKGGKSRLVEVRAV